jgi:hypothetical protein
MNASYWILFLSKDMNEAWELHSQTMSYRTYSIMPVTLVSVVTFTGFSFWLIHTFLPLNQVWKRCWKSFSKVLSVAFWRSVAVNVFISSKLYPFKDVYSFRTLKGCMGRRQMAAIDVQTNIDFTRGLLSWCKICLSDQEYCICVRTFVLNITKQVGILVVCLYGKQTCKA